MDIIDSNEFSDIIKDLLQGYIKPKVFDVLDKLGKKFEKKKELFSHDLLENKFKDYLETKVTDFLIIDTLVFPNYQTLIKTIYEPLYIRTRYQSIGEVLIDEYPSDLFNNLQRILIQDSAGMGKSTISRIMFLDAVNKSAGIPFHIELRKINSSHTILNEICIQLKLLDNSEQEVDFVKELIKRGDFIFILDGYDEVAFKDREKVAGFIHQLLSLGDNCKFCLTSRPEAGLTSFGDFISFEILELTKEQAHSIFRRLDIYAFKPIADDLISAIEESSTGNDDNILEFLGNPLLASLLYKTFDFKKNLPDNLSQFYRQIYDALFENHDLSKEGYFKREKFSKLHIDDFEKILRCLGFQTSVLGENEYNKDQLIQLIEKANKFFPNIKFRPSDFVKDITSTVPLFKREGLTFKWSHKSLQDYFGAKFLYSDYQEKRDQTLLKFFHESSNLFLLKIYNSLDSKTFRKVCVKSFLDDYISYCNEQIEYFKEAKIEGNIHSWIDLSYYREVQFAYTEPDDFELEALKTLSSSEKDGLNIRKAEKKWQKYLQNAVSEMKKKISYQSYNFKFGQSGPICDKYIYHLRISQIYEMNVLVDIYPALFTQTKMVSENSNKKKLCRVVSKLKPNTIYNLLNRVEILQILSNLDEVNEFISLLPSVLKVDYQNALKLHGEIDDEIESAKILDGLF